MKINEASKKMLLKKLGSMYPEKVVLEVMDEYLYCTIREIDTAKGAGDLHSLFLKEIKTCYLYDYSHSFRGFFGETILFHTINAGMHSGVFITSMSMYHPALKELIDEVIKDLFSSHITFIDSLNEAETVKTISHKLIYEYHKRLATLVMVLEKDFFINSGLHEGIALKTDSEAFLSNLSQFDIDNEVVIKNVDPEAFARGEYDYVKEVFAFCL